MTKLITLLCFAMTITACASHAEPKTTVDSSDVSQPSQTDEEVAEKKPSKILAVVNVFRSIIGGMGEGLRRGSQQPVAPIPPTYTCRPDLVGVKNTSYSCNPW